MLMEFMEISVSQGAISQGASQGRSFLARAFDLARPGVAPPLRHTPIEGSGPKHPQILRVPFSSCLDPLT